MAEINPSMSLSNPHPANFNGIQKTGLAITSLGILAILLALTGAASSSPLIFLIVTLAGLIGGGLIYAYGSYGNTEAGIKNNRTMFSSMSSRGALAWMTGIIITAFYICLYWKDYWIKIFGFDLLAGLVKIFDPLSMALRKTASDQWFVYGTFYTVAVVVMGIKFIYKYRHNTYQKIRTISVMFFQLGLAWLLPGIMKALYNFEPYYTYFWPLDYDAIWPSNISYLQSEGNLGKFFLFWGIALSFVATPILTYFFGKRWYCSWVCGCGGLAETAGDPYRQLSDKSNEAWQIERVMIHSVLALITLATIFLFISASMKENFSFSVNQYIYYFLLAGFGFLIYKLQRHFYPFVPAKRTPWVVGTIIVFIILFHFFTNMAAAKQTISFSSVSVAHWYSFFIGMVFSGVVGVGFYPIMGSRVWCRFGCPMAAYLGLIQRFKSRFRITTNGGQCISCGNCSTYCEMGIDVRAYAQKGQNIVRSSCVGCGVCSAVCPRGVLKLESGPDTTNRTNILFSSDDLKILS